MEYDRYSTTSSDGGKKIVTKSTTVMPVSYSLSNSNNVNNGLFTEDVTTLFLFLCFIWFVDDFDCCFVCCNNIASLAAVAHYFTVHLQSLYPKKAIFVTLCCFLSFLLASLAFFSPRAVLLIVRPKFRCSTAAGHTGRMDNHEAKGEPQDQTGRDPCTASDRHGRRQGDRR